MRTGKVIDRPTNDELVMGPNERIEMAKTEEAADLGTAASALESACAILTALPNLMTNVEPRRMGASLKFDGGNVAESMMIAAGMLKATAQARNDGASRAARKSHLIQQLQERRLQANTAPRDIKNVDKQLESQRLKATLADLEFKSQAQQSAHLAEMDEFLESKYSS